MFAIFKPGRENQGGEIAAVVDMKMAEEKNIHFRHLCIAFSKAESAAPSRVHHHPRLPVLPDEIAARGALILQLRPTGAQHLHRHASSTAGLRRCTPSLAHKE